jgi:BirA family transcriptional regulator, biotin operon repressor / biotin---[acetyl-CoA-carboxylase] ligase
MSFKLGPRAASASYRLAAFDQIGSTNAEAMARAREGERGPMWFVTTEQTAGRGRRNRPWIAPRGNLASSILEVMDTTPLAAAMLGFAAGLAAQQALRKTCTEAARRSRLPTKADFLLKWPNDVMAEGRKCVGINLEAETISERLAIVVGIGTNVVSAPEGTPTPATSLAALGFQVTAEELFVNLSDAWAEFRGIWDNGRGFANLRKSWLAGAVGLGEPVAIRSGNVTIEGTFDTLDEQGCMIVRTSEGRLIPITAGDVHFGSAASARAD